MKKYPISKFYVGIYIVDAAIILPFLAFGIYCLTEFMDIYGIIFTAVGAIGALAWLYQILFDFPFGSFYVDSSGITMNVGFRKYCHAWNAITDVGFVQANVGDGNTYWVFFSERFLTYDEKRRFLRKTRRDLKSIAYFQYNAAVLKELLPKLPERFAEKIQKEETRVQEQLSLIEKIYHK